MKTKLKTSLENKFKKLLNNNNFRNNQNYIINFSNKKKFLVYAYTVKREKTLFKSKQLYIQNYNNDRFKTGKLYKGNFGYIIKPSFSKKLSLNILNNPFFVFGFLLLIGILNLVIGGGEVSYNNSLFILDDISFFERIIKIKSLLILTILIFILGFIKKYFFSYNEFEKYLIFKENIRSNKIIIYRYR